jgi:hypothetical protein
MNLIKLSIISALLLIIPTLQAQDDALYINLKHPRSKRNHTAPGNYEIVALINKTQINAGDSALITLFFTGYGKIDQAKVFMTCSSFETFDTMVLRHSIGHLQDGKLYWGEMTTGGSNLPTLLHLGGFGYKMNDTIYTTGSFIDQNTHPDDVSILTERTMINPPVSIMIHFKETARADDYSFRMDFTYFNGVEWKSSVATLDFRINSWVQRHETLLQVIAFIAALFTFIPYISKAWIFWSEQYKKIKKSRWPKLQTTPAKKSAKA